MVKFDQQLLIAARCLMTEANVHHLKGLIFAYEQAVYLHNRQWAPHMIYQTESEQRLRRYVAGAQRQLREQTPTQSTNRKKL